MLDSFFPMPGHWSSRGAALLGARPFWALALVLGLSGCGEDAAPADPAPAAGATGATGTGGGGGGPQGGNAGGAAAAGTDPGAGGAGASAGADNVGGASAGNAGAGAGDSPGGATGNGGAGGAGTGTGGSFGGGVTGNVPILDVGGGRLKLELCAPNVIRVAFSTTDAFLSRETLATAPRRCEDTLYQLVEEADATTVVTERLKARIDLATGAITFFDPTDQLIVAESPDGRALSPAMVQGEQTNNVQQTWEPNPGEALYGLGQHQFDTLDLKGFDLDLTQYNTQVVVPFLVSSRGYGVLWDNTSFTRFGDLRPFEAVPVSGLYGGGVSVNGAGSGSVSFQGSFEAPETGDYLFRTFSSGQIRLTINGDPVIDHFRQGWLTDTDLAKVPLQAGQSVMLGLEWSADPDFDVNVVSLDWKTPSPSQTTSLWSEVGEGIDYTFVYGPDLDQVVAGYRRMTGEAPMMPRWAFGFWQSRERYQSAQEVLDTLDGFRSRGIPLDVIVQDWQYWPEAGWGSHEFDPTRFPDPNGWIQSIHDDYDARLMISVWPKFDVGTDTFNALDDADFIYQPNLDEGVVDFLGDEFGFYDAFDAGARTLFWSQMNTALFSRGVDAWWMDGPEPDIVEGPFDSSAEHKSVLQSHMHPTALGTGARMLNAYSLVNSQAVYEGQRAAAPDQRVFILTRSAFAGQQRYASATWSGDITSTWTALKKQIPAGLGFSISGIPYWTMDSGGFAVPARLRQSANADEWRELNTRWFEYATFLPITRMHGQAPVREMWQFGGEQSPAYQAMLKFDRLRYRLLPYIYSLAGEVTHEAGTMLRPLVMDFPTDAPALAITDQYLFGQAFLVSPITDYQSRSRSVYLPSTPGGWYDFWSGAAVAGGGAEDASAALDSMPVHVRAGSIVPIGPELEFTDQAPADPITLYVYSGADGSFTLYEDQGLSYAYEQGAFTRIAISWNEATRTLTLGAREGSFPEMLASRTFDVVLVSPEQAVGFSFSPTPAQTVAYDGAEASVTL